MSNPKSKRTQKLPVKKQSPPKKNKSSSKKTAPPKTRVAVPAAFATGQSSTGPQVISGKNFTRIIHRELVTTVYSSNGFKLTPFRIQPGAPQTFRWLSIMAQCWEKYRFNFLRFRYVTRTGTGTSGSVSMVFDYDAGDDSPSSEQIMSSYEGIQEDVPWKDNVCHALRSRLEGTVKDHFIRLGQIPVTQDLRFYDAANFYLGTSAAAEGQEWGRLWVEYDVTLMIPQLPPTGELVFGGSFIGSLPATAGLPFGPTPTADTQNNQVGMLVVSAGTVNQLRIYSAGTYLLTSSFSGTGLALVNLGTPNNLTVVNQTSIPNSGGTAILSYATLVVPQILGGAENYASVNFSVSGVSPTVTGAAARIGQAPNGSQDLI